MIFFICKKRTGYQFTFFQKDDHLQQVSMADSRTFCSHESHYCNPKACCVRNVYCRYFQSGRSISLEFNRILKRATKNTRPWTSILRPIATAHRSSSWSLTSFEQTRFAVTCVITSVDSKQVQPPTLARSVPTSTKQPQAAKYFCLL